MAIAPSEVVVRVTRADSARNVWRKLAEMEVPRRQRILVCLVAWSHPPRDVVVPIKYERRNDAPPG